MRGTPAVEHIALDQIRFIPAYAGNAVVGSAAMIWLTIHPRVCGERSFHGANPNLSVGSSPRMRGTPWSRHFRHQANRFIPAYAGNAFSK